jgi:hypothetical protein
MKNSKLLLSVTLLLCFTNINAQWGSNTINGNGNLTTTTIQTSDYDGVSVAGNFYVTLVEGKEGSITLKGESNLLEEIVVEIKNGNLHIKPEDRVNLKPSRGMKIEITVPVEQISKVALAGSGEIKNAFDLKSDKLAVKLAGSGDIKLNVTARELESTIAGSGNIILNGRASELKGRIAGSGSVDAYRLDADNANITISGSGDYNVNCTGELKVRVSGSGNVNYRGKPDKIDTKVAGSGRIRSAN